MHRVAQLITSLVITLLSGLLEPIFLCWNSAVEFKSFLGLQLFSEGSRVKAGIFFLKLNQHVLELDVALCDLLDLTPLQPRIEMLRVHAFLNRLAGQVILRLRGLLALHAL